MIFIEPLENTTAIAKEAVKVFSARVIQLRHLHPICSSVDILEKSSNYIRFNIFEAVRQSGTLQKR
jgi:hypothetical protein